MIAYAIRKEEVWFLVIFRNSLFFKEELFGYKNCG